MQEVRTGWRVLLLGLAASVAMLLFPAGVSAHVAMDRLLLAGHTTASTPEGGKAFAFDCMADCLTPAPNHRVHCHLSSLPSMTDRWSLSPDDDPPVAVVFALPTQPAQNFGKHFAPKSGVPVTALPSFILFGNFRS